MNKNFNIFTIIAVKKLKRKLMIILDKVNINIGYEDRTSK